LPDLDGVLERIAALGRGAPAQPRFGASRGMSAVLVALFDAGQGPEVLLTRRTATLSSHRGEIAFPGGRGDPGETPAQTAIREAFEEVGLDPALPVVCGELDRMTTLITLSEIVPVVARLPGRPVLQANPGEVDKILLVPLAELVSEGVWWEEHWHFAGADRAMAFFELADETVWGATARILKQLLSVAMGPESTHR
jgi:8-oxo-dGTP pyrophosphatase MutT (NUDIX family)